jgi:hypothetical protein
MHHATPRDQRRQQWRARSRLIRYAAGSASLRRSSVPEPGIRYALRRWSARRAGLAILVVPGFGCFCGREHFDGQDPRLFVVGQNFGGTDPAQPSGRVVAFPAPAPGAGKP